jgi:hypothetical protein
MKRFLVLFLVFTSGCTKYYFNHNYPRDGFTQQQNYNADNGYCVAVAHGSIPTTDIRLNNPTPNITTTGRVSIRDNDGNTLRGRYQENTQSGNFITGFADGYNIGSVIATDSNRQAVYQGCMARLGWFEIACKECVPGSTANVNDDWVAGAIRHLEAAGYSDRFENPQQGIVAFLNRSQSVDQGKVCILDIALVHKTKKAFSEKGLTFTPSYIRYLYEVQPEKGFAKVKQTEAFDDDFRLITTVSYAEPEMPTVYYDAASAVGIYIKAIKAGGR